MKLQMRQERTQINFVWNGRTYNYAGDMELLPEEVVNGLMGQRVLAAKRHVRGGYPVTGIVRGAISVPAKDGYFATIYLVEQDNGRICQAVNIKSIE